MGAPSADIDVGKLNHRAPAQVVPRVQAGAKWALFSDVVFLNACEPHSALVRCRDFRCVESTDGKTTGRTFLN